MKKFLIVLLALMTPAIAFAHKLLPTTFSMSCFIISQDDKWSYSDYGFKLTYKDKPCLRKAKALKKVVRINLFRLMRKFRLAK
jgi:hypothetical protein